MRQGQAHTESTYTLPDGTPIILDTMLRQVDTAKGPLIAAISRNVTQRRALEQRLLVSERLEALGRLAGSVAHDFNNLLMVMGGAARAGALLPGKGPPRLG